MPGVFHQLSEQLAIISTQTRLIQLALAEVFLGRLGITQRDVRFRDTQVILQCFGMRLHEPFEKLEAGFRIAMFEEGRGSDDVERTEHAGSSARAKLRIELATASCVVFDFGHEIRSEQPSLLHQSSGDYGASVRVIGCIEGFGANNIVRELSIFGAIVAGSDQVFESVGDGKRVVFVSGGGECGTDAGVGRAAGCAKACGARLCGQEKQYRPTIHGAGISLSGREEEDSRLRR